MYLAHFHLTFSSGLPTRNGIKHAPEIASLALDMLSMMRNKTFPCPSASANYKIQLRIGINTGTYISGQFLLIVHQVFTNRSSGYRKQNWKSV